MTLLILVDEVVGVAILFQDWPHLSTRSKRVPQPRLNRIIVLEVVIMLQLLLFDVLLTVRNSLYGMFM